VGISAKIGFIRQSSVQGLWLLWRGPYHSTGIFDKRIIADKRIMLGLAKRDSTRCVATG
jgi:hypothetical protein